MNFRLATFQDLAPLLPLMRDFYTYERLPFDEEGSVANRISNEEKCFKRSERIRLVRCRSQGQSGVPGRSLVCFASLHHPKDQSAALQHFRSKAPSFRLVSKSF